VRSLLVGRANLTIALLTRGRPEDSDEAGRLLQLALEAARRLILPEAQQIEQLVEQAGSGATRLPRCANNDGAARHCKETAGGDAIWPGRA
jgi:hypothetical protein